MPRRRCGFTLLELLIVISIMTTLLATLAPALQLAHRQAKRVACAGNLRALGSAVIHYAMSDGEVPVTAQRFAGRRDRPDLAANLIYHRPTGFDLGASLESYVHPSGLNCPEARQGVYRAPSPTTETVYSSYIFLWGAVAGTPERGFDSIDMAPPATLIAADLAWNVYHNQRFEFAGNHLRSGYHYPPTPFVLSDDVDPVGTQFNVPTPRAIAGIHAVYVDGSVRWVPRARRAWRDAGPFHQGVYKDVRIYLPARSQHRK
jgi:prepilin-type N-terminal cleavage/methylation domain-containing protein